MTLILAAAGGDFAVVCGDTCVFVQDYPNGPRRPGAPSLKVSTKARCAIGTYGCSPPGVDVHAAIAALPDADSPEATARAILGEFRQCAAIPRMGALVAGVDQGVAVLYRVEVADNQCVQLIPELGQPPQIHAGPANRALPRGLSTDIAATPEQTVERMLEIQRAVAHNADDVGLPFDCIVVRAGETPWSQREDA